MNIIGSLFNQSGYSRHTKCLANALNELGIDIRLDVAKIDQWERHVNDFELNAISKDFDPECVSLFIGQPQFWPLVIAEKPSKFLGYLVWEGNKVPRYWKKYLKDERVDKILVPSEHVKLALTKTFNDDKIDNKVYVIPEGYDPSVFYPIDNKHDTFCFMANKGWSKGMNDRGGIQFLIKAFSEEFNKDDNVELKIKLNTVYNSPGWDLKKEIDSLNLPEDRPKIMTCTSNLDNKAMNDFYNEGDVFVTTSMAEGFNLPALEAMACGLPVIATNYGGHLDFVNDSNGFLIDDLEMGFFSDEIAYEDILWAKPKIECIRKKLREAFESNLEEKRNEAIKTASKFTWRDSAKKILNLI